MQYCLTSPKDAAHSEAAEELESEDTTLDSHRRIFLRLAASL